MGCAGAATIQPVTPHQLGSPSPCTAVQDQCSDSDEDTGRSPATNQSILLQGRSPLWPSIMQGRSSFPTPAERTGTRDSAMPAISLPHSPSRLTSLRASTQQQVAANRSLDLTQSSTGVSAQTATRDVSTSDAPFPTDDRASLGRTHLPGTTGVKPPTGDQPSVLGLQPHVDTPEDHTADVPFHGQEAAVAGPPVQTYGTWSSEEVACAGMSVMLLGGRCRTASLRSVLKRTETHYSLVTSIVLRRSGLGDNVGHEVMQTRPLLLSRVPIVQPFFLLLAAKLYPVLSKATPLIKLMNSSHPNAVTGSDGMHGSAVSAYCQQRMTC